MCLCLAGRKLRFEKPIIVQLINSSETSRIPGPDRLDAMAQSAFLAGLPSQNWSGLIGDIRKLGGSNQESRDEKVTFSEERIATALRQVESGAPVAQVSLRMSVSEATFYLWKKQIAHLSTSELREHVTGAFDLLVGRVRDEAAIRTWKESGGQP
jgi:transposase-like protein